MSQKLLSIFKVCSLNTNKQGFLDIKYNFLEIWHEETKRFRPRLTST